MTEDPIGFGGGINLYGYVGNNALAWIDPFGLRHTALYRYIDILLGDPDLTRQQVLDLVRERFAKKLPRLQNPVNQGVGCDSFVYDDDAGFGFTRGMLGRILTVHHIGPKSFIGPQELLDTILHESWHRNANCNGAEREGFGLRPPGHPP